MRQLVAGQPGNSELSVLYSLCVLRIVLRYSYVFSFLFYFNFQSAPLQSPTSNNSPERRCDCSNNLLDLSVLRYGILCACILESTVGSQRIADDSGFVAERMRIRSFHLIMILEMDLHFIFNNICTTVEQYYLYSSTLYIPSYLDTDPVSFLSD